MIQCSTSPLSRMCSALNGNCDLLADDNKLDSEQAEQIQDMQLSCRQMRAVMTDVLDMNKIASGAMTLERLPFSVEDIALKTVRQFRGVAELRNLDIVVFVASNVPETVLGDPSRVAQCLTNLVSNSCKFVPEHTGRIHIYISSAEVLRTVTTDSQFLIEPASSSLPSDAPSDPTSSLGRPLVARMQRLHSAGSPLRRPRRHSVSGSTTHSPKLSTLSDREEALSDLGISSEPGSNESPAMQRAVSAKLFKLEELPSIPMAKVRAAKMDARGGAKYGRGTFGRRACLQDYRTISRSQGNLLAFTGAKDSKPTMAMMPHTVSMAPSWNIGRFTSGTGEHKPRSKVGQGPAQVQLLFQVVDNGPGLYPHEQKRLFKSFQQARASVARQHGGSGLGLMIVKTLCESMGGTAAVRSAHGAGSNFWFSINADVQLPAAVTGWRKKSVPHSVSVPVGGGDGRVGYHTGAVSIDDSSASVVPGVQPDLLRYVSGASSAADSAAAALELEQYQKFAAAVQRLNPYKAFLSVPATPDWAGAALGDAGRSKWAPLQTEATQSVAQLLGTVETTEAEEDVQGSVVYHRAATSGGISPEEALAAACNQVPAGMWRRVEAVISKQHAHRLRTSAARGYTFEYEAGEQGAADAAARVISGSKGPTVSGGEMSTPRAGASDIALLPGQGRTNVTTSHFNGTASQTSLELPQRSVMPSVPRGSSTAVKSERWQLAGPGTVDSSHMGQYGTFSPSGPPTSLPQSSGNEHSGRSSVLHLNTAPGGAPGALWASNASCEHRASASSPKVSTQLLSHGEISALYQSMASSGASSQRSGTLQASSPLNQSSPRRTAGAALMLADINAAGRNVPNTSLHSGLAASIHHSTGTSARSGRRRASDGQASAGAAAAALSSFMDDSSEVHTSGHRNNSVDHGLTSGQGSASGRHRGSASSQRRGSDPIRPQLPYSTKSAAGASAQRSAQGHLISPVTELSSDAVGAQLTPLLKSLCTWRPVLDWPGIATEQVAVVAGLATLRVKMAASALKEEQWSPTRLGTKGSFSASVLARPGAASRYMARCDDEGNGTVFVADDDGTQRRMLGNTLKRQQGLREMRFDDGLALLEEAMGCLPWKASGKAAPTCALGSRAQVICFDVNMSPGMGGVPATRLLRLVEVAFMRRVTPVIAITANSDLGDRMLYARAGMSALVGKPLDRSHLLMTVEQLLRKRSVLVVTDDQGRAEGAAAYLREQGHNVLGVLDSAELLGIALGTIVDAGQAARAKLSTMSAKIRQHSGEHGAVSSVHAVELQEAALESVWRRCIMLSCRAPWHGTWGDEVQRQLKAAEEAKGSAEAAGGGGAPTTTAASRAKAGMSRGQSGMSGTSSGLADGSSGGGGSEGGEQTEATAAPAEHPSGTHAVLHALRETHSLGTLQPWGADAVIVMTWHGTKLPEACLAKWQAAIPGPTVPFLHLHHADGVQQAATFDVPDTFESIQPPVHAARGAFWGLSPDQQLSACLPSVPATSPKISGMTFSQSLSPDAASSSSSYSYSAWQPALAEVMSVGPLLGTPSDAVWTPPQQRISQLMPLLAED